MCDLVYRHRYEIPYSQMNEVQYLSNDEMISNFPIHSNSVRDKSPNTYVV